MMTGPFHALVALVFVAVFVAEAFEASNPDIQAPEFRKVWWQYLDDNEHYEDDHHETRSSTTATGSLSTEKSNKPNFRSTGTTIAGLVWEDTVYLAADTRATSASLVADPRTDKLHVLSPSIVAAGAGTAADVEHLTRQVAAVVRLRRLQYGVEDDVAAVCQWLSSRQSSYEATLIVGGLDATGKPRLNALHAAGSTDHVLYTALGSGGLAAMGVLERGYPQVQSAQQAEQLVTDAVRAGVENDLGSGSNVDLCIISSKLGCRWQRARVPEETLPRLPSVETQDPIVVSSRRVIYTGNKQGKRWEDVLH